MEIIFSSYSCNFCILGKKTLLDYSNDAGFIVLGNKPGMDIELFNFHKGHMIAHMSEAKVVLKNDETVTLFCVSSTHCRNSEYDRTCDAEPTGVSSPVLYAKRPGNYQCVVTLHSEMCISGKIEVVQGEILVCVHYVPVDCLL